MKYVQKPCKICGYYRERMSECRNCDPSDMPYKVCFQKKVDKKNPLMSKIFRMNMQLTKQNAIDDWNKRS